MGLQFTDVVVEYPSASGETLRALDGFSLSVAKGEAISIIGPSGCGKSTMLRLAAGLMAPTGGTVVADGEVLEKPRKGTSLILQDFGLLPWKTVFKNAELGLKIQKVPAAERRTRVEDALEQVGLTGFERSYPNELSGGMQQRLALARALAMDTDILLMDEPLSALDALLREELQETLLSLWNKRGYTSILVTHSIEEAVLLGQRVVVMAPRPSRVVDIIDNPGMGSASYRGEEDFFACCRKVRAALDGGAR